MRILAARIAQNPITGRLRRGPYALPWRQPQMNTKRTPWLLAASASLLLLAACTPAGPANGTLALTVNAPSGVTPSVTVSGPSGNTAVTATGTKPLSLKPGTYTIAATDVKNAGYTYKGTASPSSVLVESNKTASAAVTYAVATGKLTVNLTAPSGQSPTVTVAGPNNFNQNLTTSQTLNDLAPGVYTITATPLPGLKTVISNNGSASVVAGQETTASVTYSTGQVSIAVAINGLPSGAPAPKVTAKQGSTVIATINGPGTITGPVGTYTVSGDPVSYAGTTYTAQDVGPLNLPNDGSSANATLMYAPSTGTLNVTITGLPSASTDTVTVTVTPTGGSPTPLTRSGNGTVSFTNLPPGNYTVGAADVATPSSSPTALYKAALSSNPITVAAGGTATVTATYTQAPTSVVVTVSSIPTNITNLTARLLSSSGTEYTQPISGGTATFNKTTLSLSSELPLGTYLVSVRGVVKGGTVDTAYVATFGPDTGTAVEPTIKPVALSASTLTQTVTNTNFVSSGGSGRLYVSGNGYLSGGNKGILYLVPGGGGLNVSTTPVSSPAYYKVAFDPQGYYYIAARSPVSNTISVYTEAQLRDIEKGYDPGPPQFSIAGGPLTDIGDMVFDGGGNLWVASEQNYVTCYSAQRLAMAKAATPNTVTIGQGDVAIFGGTSTQSLPSFYKVRALAYTDSGLWMGAGVKGSNDNGPILSRVKPADLSCPYSASIVNREVAPEIALYLYNGTTDPGANSPVVTKPSSIAVSGTSVWVGDFGPDTADVAAEAVYEIPLTGSNALTHTTYTRVNAQYGSKLNISGMQQVTGLSFDKQNHLWVATNNNFDGTTVTNGALYDLGVPTNTAAAAAPTPVSVTPTKTYSSSIGLTGLVFNTIAP